MAINCRCDNCGGDLQVRDEDAGKTVRCPRCGMFTAAIPAPGSASARPAGEPAWADRAFGANAGDEWFLRTPDGGEWGPVSRQELDGWQSEGRVSASCLVRRAGGSRWESAVVLYPGLTQAPEVEAPGDPVRAGARERAAGPETDPPRPAPVWIAQSSAPRANYGLAVLAVGILGMATFFLPLFGIAAWLMGREERRAIYRGEASADYRLLLDIGYGLGIVATLAGTLVWMGCFLVFGLFR